MVAQPPGSSWGTPPPPPPLPPPPPPGVPYQAVVPLLTQFRRLRGLAISMYVLLAIAGLMALIVIPVAIHSRTVIHDHASNGTFLVDSTVKSAANAVSAVVGLLLLVSLAITVLFIIWMWRAASNLPLFGRVRPKFSPGFAIGGWFIPLANFIIPGMQMFEIDKGSGPRLRAGERPRGSGLVVVWWIVFVVGRLGAFAAPSFKLFHRYKLGGFDVVNLILVVCSALTAIAAVLAVLVIRRITARQDAGAAELAAGPTDQWDGVAAVPQSYSPPPQTYTAQPYQQPQAWNPPAPPAPPPPPE